VVHVTNRRHGQRHDFRAIVVRRPSPCSCSSKGIALKTHRKPGAILQAPSIAAALVCRRIRRIIPVFMLWVWIPTIASVHHKCDLISRAPPRADFRQCGRISWAFARPQTAPTAWRGKLTSRTGARSMMKPPLRRKRLSLMTLPSRSQDHRRPHGVAASASVHEFD
jgi:hypothetical protein